MNNEHKNTKENDIYCAPGLKPCAQIQKKRNPQFTLKMRTRLLNIQ
jgi:hypothetical protein